MIAKDIITPAIKFVVYTKPFASYIAPPIIGPKNAPIAKKIFIIAEALSDICLFYSGFFSFFSSFVRLDALILSVYWELNNETVRFSLFS